MRCLTCKAEIVNWSPDEHRCFGCQHKLNKEAHDYEVFKIESKESIYSLYRRILSLDESVEKLEKELAEIKEKLK